MKFKPAALLLSIPFFLVLLAAVAACGSDEPTQTSSPSLGPPPTPTAVLRVSSGPTEVAANTVPTPLAAPQPGTTPVPAATPTQVPFSSPTQPSIARAIPTATATPAPFADLEVKVDYDTVWAELLHDLYPHELSCIEATSENLQETILPDSWEVTDYDLEIFGCLEPGTARAVFLGYLMSDLMYDDEWEPTSVESACMQDVAEGTNVVELLASMGAAPLDSLAFGEFMADIFRCIPSWVVMVTFGMATPSMEGLPESEANCIRELMARLTGEAVLRVFVEDDEFWNSVSACVPSLVWGVDDSPEDDHGDAVTSSSTIRMSEEMTGTIDYEGDADYFGFETAPGTFYRIRGHAEMSSSQFPVDVFRTKPYEEHLYTGSLLHGDPLGSYTTDEVFDFTWQESVTGAVHIAVFGAGDIGASYTVSVEVTTVNDDHANIHEGATPLEIGQRAAGDLEYRDDLDSFRVLTQAGMVYRVSVDLGTLEDSTVVIEDDRGWAVAYNDDDDTSLASRAAWKSEATGSYFITVGGYGTGTYSVTVMSWADDHGDSSETATPLRAGESLESYIDTEDDIDYFAFQAEEGGRYLIETAPGELEDTYLTLFDRRGEIAANDDQEGSLAARLEWESPATGTYWIAVAGFGTGSYHIVVRPAARPKSCPTGTAESAWLSEDFWQGADSHEVQFELRCGADVQARNVFEWTPLHLAARADNAAAVRALLEGGAHIEAKAVDSSTPLHIAAYYDKPAAVSALLSAGADVDRRNDEGHTPLHVAASFGKSPVVGALLESGAHVNAKAADNSTPLHIAARSENLMTLLALMDAGAGLESRDENGWAPLHTAVAYDAPLAVRVLLQGGANLEPRDEDGVSPLHLAVRLGKLEVIRVLLDLGADTETRSNDGETPLHAAVTADNTDAARLLLEAGADAEARDGEGRTSLDIAEAAQRSDILDLLNRSR